MAHRVTLGIEDQFSAPLEKLYAGMEKSASSTDKLAARLRSVENIAGQWAMAFNSMGSAVDRMNQRLDLVGQASQKVSAAGQVMKQYGQATEETSKKVEQTGQAHERAGRSILTTATGIATGLFVYKMASEVLQQFYKVLSIVPQAAIGFNANLEQTTIAFKNLFGSATLADDMVRKMFKFAAETPFMFQDVVEATRRLSAYGFTLEEIIPVMTAIGNAAAGLATGAVGIDRMSLALGQITAKGKVQGTELRQLGEAGVKVYDIMAIVADKMGLSLAQVIALQEQGKLKAKVFVDAFKEWSAVKFGDMMLVQSRTFNGAISTISDNVNMVIAKGFKPLFDMLSENIVKFAEFTKTAAFEAWAKTIEKQVVGVMARLRELGEIAAGIITIISGLKNVAAGAGAAGRLLPSVFQEDQAKNLREAYEWILKTIRAREAHAQAAKAEAAFVQSASADQLVSLQRINDRIKEINREVFIHPFADPKWKAMMASIIADLEELKRKVMGALILPVILKVEKVKPFDVSAFMLPAVEGYSEEIEKWLADVGKVASNTQDFFVSMINDAVKAGQISVVFAEEWKSSLGIVEEDVDKFKNLFGLFADALKDKSVDVKVKITKAFADIMDDASLAWTEKYPLLLMLLDELTKGALDVSKKVGDAMSDLFVKMINDATAAGDVSAGFADNWKAALGIVETDIDKFKNIFKLIGDELKGKSKDVQIYITSAMSAIFSDVGLSWDQKYTALIKIFDIVKKASLDAANGMVDDWTAAFNAVIQAASGLSKIYEAYHEAPEKAVGKVYEKSDFEKEVIAVEELEAKLPGLYEDVRRIRGLSTAKEYNWLFPDENIIRQKEATIADYERRIAEHRAKQKEMEAWNAGAAERIAAEQKKAMGDLGGFMAKLIMAQELAGTITEDTANRMYEAYEAMFGKALTKGEQYQLGVQRYSAEMEQFGEKGLLAFAGIMKEAVKSKDPLEFIKTAVEDYKNRITESETQTKLFRLGLISAADTVNQKVDPAFEGLKKDVDDFLKTLSTDVPAALLAITSKVYHFKGILEIETPPGGGGGDGEDPNNPPPEKQGYYTWYNLKTRKWQYIPIGMPPEPFMGAANLGGLFEPPPMAAPNVASVEQVVGQIQRIMNLISGLSIDPRIKDMSDAVRSAMDAFKSGLDAISSLAEYTGKGVSNVDKAFADIKTIADKFLGLYFLWAQSVDYERFSKVSESVSRSLDAFKSGIDALILLADYTGKGRENIDKALADMLVIAQGFFAMSARFAELDADQAKLFAEASSAIFGAFKAGIDAVASLAEYTGKGVENAKQAFADMQTIAQLFMDAAAKIAEDVDLKKASSFAETAGRIYDAFRSGLDTLKQLRDYTSPARSRIWAAMDDLLYIARVIADNAKVIDPKIGEGLRSIGEGVKSMVEPLIAIKKYLALARTEANIAPALEAFTRDLFGLFGRLSYLAVWVKQQGELAKQMKELGEVLQSIFPPLVSAIDVLKGIRVYIPLARIGDIAPAFDAFFADLGGLFGRLGYLAEWLASPARLALADQMKQLGEVMAVIFSPLKDALDVLVAIGDYTPLKRVGKIAPALQSFMDDVQGLFGRLGYLAQWLSEREGLGQKMIDLGEALSSVMSGIKAAADALLAIRDYADRAGATAGSIKESMLTFDAALRVLLDIIRAWAASGPGLTGYGKVGDIRPIEITEKMKEFAILLSETLAPMQTVIGVVEGFVKLAKDLEDGIVDMEKVIQTIDDVTRDLVDKMKIWFEGKEKIELSPELRDYAIMLQETLEPMQTIVGIAQNAVDLAMSIYEEEYILADAFALIDAVTRKLIEMVTDWAGLGTQGAAITIPKGLKDYAILLGEILSPMQSVMSIASSAADLAMKIVEEEFNLADAMNVVNEATWRMISALADWANIASGRGDFEPLVIMEGMKTYAILLSAILSPMQAVIQSASSALDLAKRVSEGTESISDAMVQVNLAAQQIVLRIKQWMSVGRAGQSLDIGTEMDPARNPLAQYATLLSAILSPMQAIISTTTGALDLAKRVTEGTESLADAMTITNEAARLLVYAVEDWSSVWEEGTVPPPPSGGRSTRFSPIVITERMKDYAVLLSAILSPMQSVISTVTGALDLADRVAGGTESLVSAMTTLTDGAVALVNCLKGLQDTLDIGTEMDIAENPLALYATLLSAIISPLQSVMSTIMGALDLADRVVEETGSLSDAMTMITDATKLLIECLKGLRDTLDIGEEMDPKENALAQYAALLSAIISPLQSIISTVSSALDLSERVAKFGEWTTLTNIYEVIIFAADQLITALKGLQDTLDVGDILDPDENPLAQYATLLSAIFSPLQTIISTVSSALDLSEKVAGFGEWTALANISEVIEFGAITLVQILKDLQGLLDLGTEMDPAKNPLAKFATLLSAVIAPFGSIISTISSALDLSEKMKDKIVSWAKITETIEMAVRLLVALMSELQADAVLAAAVAAITAPTGADKKSFAERLEMALSPIATAISVMDGLIGLYENLKDKTVDWDKVMLALKNGILRVVARISEIARDPAVLAALRDVTPEFTEGLQRVFAPMSEAIDVMMKLGTYKALSRISRDRIPVMVQALADDIRDFLIAFELAAQGIDFTPELTELGEALAAIVGPVNEYILNYYWLGRYVGFRRKEGRPTGSQWLPEPFLDLADDLMMLVMAIGAIKDQPGMPEALEKAEEVSEMMEPVVDVVADLLTMFKQLEYKIPDLGPISLVIGDIFQTLLRSLAMVMTPEGIALMLNVSTYMRPFVDTLNETLKFLDWIGNANVPKPGKIADVWTAINLVVTDAMQPAPWYDLGNLAGRNLVQGLVDGVMTSMDMWIAAMRELRNAANNELLGTEQSGVANRTASAGVVTATQQTIIQINGPLVNVQGGQYDEQKLAELIGLQLGRLQVQYARIVVPQT